MAADAATATATSGYCPATGVYHSLRAPVPLPPTTLPLSITAYAFSLLPTPLPSHPAVLDVATSSSLSYPALLAQVSSLSSSLRSLLSPGDVAFVLSPPDINVPVLYLSLLSIGVIVAPANPASSVSEISHQCALTNPTVVFTHSSLAHKLSVKTLIITTDSPQFTTFLSTTATGTCVMPEVKQSDTAAILFSSGTTGRVKGVVLTHRNFIALVAGYYAGRAEREKPAVALFTLPLFHVFGFFMVVRAVALSETVALMGRFEMSVMLKAIEEWKVTYMPVSPPLVVGMAKSLDAGRYDLSSLEAVACGGAPLRKEVAEGFVGRFPHVKVLQGYGLTESTGGASGTNVDEPAVHGSVGLITANMEAKIVDVKSGVCLPPGQPGELWLRGPTIMSGYIGDDEATASTLDSEGWLKTGDLCYFDHNGHLFIEDRLKELIKYKAYQVPPAELEDLLQSHPEIADAAVVPYPHEEAGQIPMAFVVKQPRSTLTEEQVMDFVAEQVAPYKKVRLVAFVSTIPKSAAGKILRRELVNQTVSGPTSKL